MGDAKRPLGAVLVYLAAVAALAAGVWWYGFTRALDREAEKGASSLSLASDRLTGQLQRYRELGVFLADHPQVRSALAGQGGAQGAGQAADGLEAVLLRTMDKTGSLGLTVIGPDGGEVVASEGASARRHEAQPYFERAMDGAIGVFHTVSDRYPAPGGAGRRTFLFAAPVFSEAGPVSGVVLVETNAEALEAEWRGDRPDVYFTDALGVVFLSNRSELLFMARDPAGPMRDRTAAYPHGLIQPFFGFEAKEVAGRAVWRLDAGRYLPDEALHLSLDLPTVDLTAEALIDLAPARQLAMLQAAVAAALALGVGAMLFLATERRRTLALANQKLEDRVARRTRELEEVNQDLRREVADRTAAEERLRVAQAELVQAGKLSALGQMSAGISHELNQPLMAIRSFAENAEAFIDRGQPEKARSNLGRISELGRRMGRIIKNLRAFARQEETPPGDVDLIAVIGAALEMSSARARQAGVEILWDAPGSSVIVRGGEVRLQQVLLNLIGNAIDAMDGSDEKRVEIGLVADRDAVRLTIRDTGPGISEPDRIFDPFYTTKQVGEGEGMGLGLSISYGLVQSFGGAIRGRGRPRGLETFAGRFRRKDALVSLALLGRQRRHDRRPSGARLRPGPISIGVRPIQAAASERDGRRPAQFSG